MGTRQPDVSLRSPLSTVPTTAARATQRTSTLSASTRSATAAFGYVDFDAAASIGANAAPLTDAGAGVVTSAASAGYVDFDCLDTVDRPRAGGAEVAP